VSTRKISIEIDEALLNNVQRLLGTATLKDTIEEALRELLRQQARRDEVQELTSRNGLDLTDRDITSTAWRT
jgi:Arc/MetJ family transcription regulator